VGSGFFELLHLALSNKNHRPQAFIFFDDSGNLLLQRGMKLESLMDKLGRAFFR
jgi:hypothetical protein